MGKFIYSIRFLFIALFTITFLSAADKSYKIVSTDIQTIINNDGTVDFIETREFSFKGSFTLNQINWLLHFTFFSLTG